MWAHYVETMGLDLGELRSQPSGCVTFGMPAPTFACNACLALTSCRHGCLPGSKNRRSTFLPALDRQQNIAARRKLRVKQSRYSVDFHRVLPNIKRFLVVNPPPPIMSEAGGISSEQTTELKGEWRVPKSFSGACKPLIPREPERCRGIYRNQLF